ncbi:UDP-N-acetylmuramoyl-L-alanine--D-glutamate ligase [Acidocella aromatica]|uniref:UDP-N-acetylmuramoylalanine--D-glutamate ligase n=1 Tax=Acidocella aromatica TaxID=1303579 RepID=A0A840V7G2_9PROT|nr:UDP-N-acetylmuramoyl-L-alanine--D-glutamate ligase [Acidocella aromatica]MBB5371918.1 UDP-N-acetylmuramoylalanine--D-glutamate ligase [Acidocella aromatica]
MNVFSGQRFAVVGLGRAGLPAAERLREFGAEVFVWDDSAPSREAAKAFAVTRPSEVTGRLDGVVLSPGIPHILPKPHPEAVWAAAHGVPVLTDAELLYRAVRGLGSKARFAGITGTNGKSTTTALLAHILNVAGVPNAAGANLGPAALSLPILPDEGVYVLEMSSYMLERIVTLRFDTAVMLNLSPDHLDRHGDMAGYAAAKRAIFARQDESCTAVVGVDDAPSREMAAWLDTQPAKVVRISGVGQATGAKALPGEHNAQNAAAAAAMARALGVSEAAIAEGIATFPGLAHRAQEVALREGVRFINDSKATNADAASRAMACHERFVWIAGGVAKAGGIDDLTSFFPRVEKAFLIGRDGEAFAAKLSQHGVANEYVGTLEAALPKAFSAAKGGAGIVLFSPAAASFDQFPNFEVRGDVFAKLAREVAA